MHNSKYKCVKCCSLAARYFNWLMEETWVNVKRSSALSLRGLIVLFALQLKYWSLCENMPTYCHEWYLLNGDLYWNAFTGSVCVFLLTVFFVLPAPSQISKFIKEAVQQRSIQLSWQEPHQANGAIKEYEIKYYEKVSSSQDICRLLLHTYLIPPHSFGKYRIWNDKFPFI